MPRSTRVTLATDWRTSSGESGAASPSADLWMGLGSPSCFFAYRRPVHYLSPLRSRLLPRCERVIATEKISLIDQHNQEPKEQLHSSPTTKDDKSPSTNSSNRTPMPPPILKKSNTSHGETQKTTRLLLTGIGGQSITRKPSTPPTPVPPPPTRKTYFVASKAKSTKRRPVLMRRKSSQASSGASTRAHSPQRISTPLTCSSPVETEHSGDVSEVEQPLTAGEFSYNIDFSNVKS